VRKTGKLGKRPLDEGVPSEPAGPAIACRQCGRKISAALTNCQFCGAVAEAPAAVEDAEEADPLVALERIKKKVEVADQIHEQREEALRPRAFSAVLFVLGMPISLVALAIGGIGSRHGRVGRQAVGLVAGTILVIALAAIAAQRLDVIEIVVAAVVVAIGGLGHALRRWLAGESAEALVEPPPLASGAILVVSLVLLAGSGVAALTGASQEPKTKGEVPTLEASELASVPHGGRFVRVRGAIDWESGLQRYTTARGAWLLPDDPRRCPSVAPSELHERHDLVGFFVSLDDSGSMDEGMRFVAGDPFLPASRCLLRSLPSANNRVWIASEPFGSDQPEPTAQPAPWMGVVVHFTPRLQRVFGNKQLTEDSVIVFEGTPTEESTGFWAPVVGSNLSTWVAFPGGKPASEDVVIEGVQRSLAGQPETESLVNFLNGRGAANQLSWIDTSIAFDAWSLRAGRRQAGSEEGSGLKWALVVLGAGAGIALGVVGARRAAD
jgi:hypothetical protein